jgi:hypothetical protein
MLAVVFAVVLVFGLVIGRVYGLLFGLVFGLYFLMRGGLTIAEIETRALPNEGVHRSARICLALGLFAALGAGFVTGLVSVSSLGLVNGLISGLVYGQVVGLVFGLVFGLLAGGDACIKHVALRFWLARNGSTPWNYVKFLDYAIHRMLLEWFAERYVEPGTDAKKETASQNATFD